MSAHVSCSSPRTSRLLAALVASAMLVATLPPALAQTGGGGGGGTGGGGGGTGGGGTMGTGALSGVAVDAEGVVRSVQTEDPTGELMRTRIDQAMARLGADVARPSQLRKVSLTRLIEQVNKRVAAGEEPDDVMLSLAGLTRIRYVFYYPASKDIVIAGPAEGWVEMPNGRVVGLESGQPILELQDLAVALRTFAPNKHDKPLVYCSIDPTQEGLAHMQQFLREIGRQIGPGDEQFIVEGLRDSLGLQLVSVGGVPSSTHFAQVLVEADYRMKLIGIGLEEPPVNIPSFVSLANPATIAANALQRWYFVPDYQRIKTTEDGYAAEFVGQGVKLVGEDEVVAANGGREGRGHQSRASQRFTQAFTKNYEALAEEAPVYGQLRNCVDMLVASAFIQQNDLFGLAGIGLGALGNEGQYPVEVYNAPTQVASAVNSMWKGNRLMTPIGGGVEIRAGNALDAANRLKDDSGEVAKAYNELDLSKLPANRWWWD